MLAALLLLQLANADTVYVAAVPVPPPPAAIPDSLRYGLPRLRLATGQGDALVWFLQSADTFFIAAAIPDSTRSWSDRFVLSIDIYGDGGSRPGHDDFHWEFRRVLDSSVVFRGRNGRWEPPQGDPDWRLGGDRAGGGWEVSARDGPRGWSLLMRLDPVWLRGAEGRLPRLAVGIFDNDPYGWLAWPFPRGMPQASAVEQVPELWAPISR